MLIRSKTEFIKSCSGAKSAIYECFVTSIDIHKHLISITAATGNF